VTPADDAAMPAAPTSRSQKLARTILLGACGAGLVGLSLAGTTPGPSTLSAASAPAYVVQEPDALHARTFTTATVTPSAPTRVTLRASRSRSVTILKKAALPEAEFTGAWVRPSYASVVSPYGMRWGRMHKGIDFGANYGDSIRSVGDGVVVGAGYQGDESGYGQITIIRHSNGYYSAYAHQSSVVVSVGDRVHAGEVIGYVGSTGHSTGPHLHFEMRTEAHSGQINPLTWLRDHGISI
jgi:murein DD-endopeptidase MepM/ murein hydrolase activator NlpD